MSGSLLDEQRRKVAYLDTVQPRLASLRELQSHTAEELSPSFRYGDASRDALLPNVLDKAFKPLQGALRGEL